eukprot:1100339-Pelagomonas_calceolata.AAC.3
MAASPPYLCKHLVVEGSEEGLSMANELYSLLIAERHNLSKSFMHSASWPAAAFSTWRQHRHPSAGHISGKCGASVNAKTRTHSALPLDLSIGLSDWTLTHLGIRWECEARVRVEGGRHGGAHLRVGGGPMQAHHVGCFQQTTGVNAHLHTHKTWVAFSKQFSPAYIPCGWLPAEPMLSCIRTMYSHLELDIICHTSTQT